MKRLNTYKLLNMYFAYNTKANNYFLVRYYEYSNFYKKKYIKVYSEFKELTHLIYNFNDIMQKEFIENKDYFKSSLVFSRIVFENTDSKSIKQENELEIIKKAFNDLQLIVPDKYVIVDLKLVKTSAIVSKLKDLISLYLIHKKEDIVKSLSFQNNYWYNESIDIINKKLNFNDKRYI